MFDKAPYGGDPLNRSYYRPGMGAGAIPTNDRQTLIFASVQGDFAQGSAAERAAAFYRVVRESAPDIGARLSDEQLVGDAGYMTDPITAHGITNALRDADILARTIVNGHDLAITEPSATAA